GASRPRAGPRSAQLRRFPRRECGAGAGRRTRQRRRWRQQSQGPLMYNSPLRDLRFVMHELLDSGEVLQQVYSDIDYSAELAENVLEEAAKFAESVLEPLNASGDREGARWPPESLVTPKGFRA